MLASLGMFVFALDTAPYQELQRRTNWRQPTTSRVGARPATQFLGPGDDLISLSGVIAPEVAGSAASLDELRRMGDEGEAWSLVDGEGVVYGAFKIESVDERKSNFIQGGTAKRIEFAIELRRVDDDEVKDAGGWF